MKLKMGYFKEIKQHVKLSYRIITSNETKVVKVKNLKQFLKIKSKCRLIFRKCSYYVGDLLTIPSSHLQKQVLDKRVLLQVVCSTSLDG